MKTFILKGDIAYSTAPDKIHIQRDGYLICVEGISKGVYAKISNEYEHIPVIDFSGKIIVPGLSDLHIHAPQYGFRGLGTDMELLKWLEAYTFPEEGKYDDLDYAKQAYQIFAEDLKKSGTTRVCVFATIHAEATLLLMEMLEESGVKGYVGKVSMDRNAPQYLTEKCPGEEVIRWLSIASKSNARIQPILTPRFIPSCTDNLMRTLSELQISYGLPLQSHLSENIEEVEWVRKLCPQAKNYSDAYDRTGTFGSNGKTVMAHCVYLEEEEIRRMKENEVFIAHCPQSNTNLSSGIAPVKHYLKEGLSIGLGTDIAGGHSLSLFRTMADAIQVSKLRWRIQDNRCQPLTLEEAFYMGTKGGGAFFGKVGSFEEGYELDALVLEDDNLKCPFELNIRERLERLVYLSDDRNIISKFVGGKRII